MPNFMQSRQAKYGAYMGVYIIVILAVLVAINFLANRYDKSWDSTANKQYSLSDQTDKVVKNLKNDVTIYYFADQNDFQRGHDLLDRYSNLSPKIAVKYLDPVRKKAEAAAAGYRRDVTTLIASNGKNEEAKSNTEEEVTGAIIRSQKTGERTVCYVTGAGEHSLDDEQASGFGLQKQLLERDNYKSKSIHLKPAAPAAGGQIAIGQTPAAGPIDVPKECLAVVVGGPQTDYPKPVVDALQKYVEGGGHALFMLDQTLRLGREEAASENKELTDLLAGWGATVEKDLVLDLSGIGGMFGAGPEIPVILAYESHAITRPLTRVPTAFPVPRSIDVKSGGKATVEKLFGTTEDSIAVDKITGGAIDPKQGKKGPFTLAAAGTISGTPAGRFVVVGTSGWAENRAIGSRSLGNRDLFMNTINWLTADEDLISIRPKQSEDRPLSMTTQKLSLVFYLSVLVFPLAVVAFGLATWWKRR